MRALRTLALGLLLFVALIASWCLAMAAAYMVIQHLPHR